VAVKLVKRGDLSVHDRDAVLVPTHGDYGEDLLKAMDDRYGVDEQGNSLLKAWIGHLNALFEWVPGTIMVQMLGPKADQKVIFCCMADKGLKPTYPYIRDVMKKLASKKKALEIETVAMMVMGSRSAPEVNKIALEPVIAAAIGNNLHVDLYEEFAINKRAK